MHQGIQIDESHSPLVLLRVGNRVSLPDMERYLRGLEDLFARRKPFAAIVLVRDRGELDRKVLGLHGDWTKRNVALLEEYWVGVAFVFPSATLRFLLSAILLAAPSATPHEVFDRPDTALRWCDTRLSTRSLRAPSLDLTTLWGPLGVPDR